MLSVPRVRAGKDGVPSPNSELHSTCVADDIGTNPDLKQGKPQDIVEFRVELCVDVPQHPKTTRWPGQLIIPRRVPPGPPKAQQGPTGLPRLPKSHGSGKDASTTGLRSPCCSCRVGSRTPCVGFGSKDLGFPNGVCNKGLCDSVVSMEPCVLKPPLLQTPFVNLGIMMP